MVFHQGFEVDMEPAGTESMSEERERERDMGELRTSSLHNDEGKAPQLV